MMKVIRNFPASATKGLALADPPNRFAMFWTGADPGCSHKDYPVRAWIRTEQAQVILTRSGGWTLIISSSGNAAFALARATLPWAPNGKLIVVTDTLSPPEMISRLKAFAHIEAVVVDQPDATGSHAVARQKVVDDLVRDRPGSFEVSQYGNTGSVASFWANGYDLLCAEIEAAFPDVAAIVMPLGTCASIRSFAAFKMKNQRRWKIFGVDAKGSALLGKPDGARRFSGYGNGKASLWLNQAKADCDGFVRVPDRAVVQAAHRLRAEGFWVGASSAAAAVAVQALDRKGLLPHRGTTVVLLPDHGSLYASTLYNEDFLISQGLIGVPVAPEPFIIMTV